MRRLTNSKRRFGVKDLLKWVGIISLHYAFFIIYTAIFLLIRHFVFDCELIPGEIATKVIVLYVICFAPIFNGILHITYDEIGSPWLRLIMWIHSATIAILIPLMIFVYL